METLSYKVFIWVVLSWPPKLMTKGFGGVYSTGLTKMDPFVHFLGGAVGGIGGLGFRGLGCRSEALILTPDETPLQTKKGMCYGLCTIFQVLRTEPLECTFPINSLPENFNTPAVEKPHTFQTQPGPARTPNPKL